MSFYGDCVYRELPRSSDQLPISVISLATSLFAATEGGMRGWEIFKFFGRYSNEVAKMRYGSGAPSKSTMFQNFIESLPADIQRRALLELCDERPLRISAPLEAVEPLRQLVMGIAVPDSMSKAVENIDSEFVRKHWQKLMDRLSDDPEGAITASRTLVELVCRHILDEKKVEYSDKGRLNDLYNLTARHLNLAPSQQTEKNLRNMLSGCITVIDNLAVLRDKLGDAHAKGKDDASPVRRHAELAANLAGGTAVFLIATWEATRTAR